MAQLKSTSVTGNLSVTGNAVASQFIKSNGTEHQILMANGTVQDLNNFTHNIIFDYTNDYNIENINLITAKNLQLISNKLNSSEYSRIYIGNEDGLIQYRTLPQFKTDLGLATVYYYKGTLNDINALKNISSAKIGEVYYILATSDSWACKRQITAATGDNYETYWSNLGANVDLSGYVTLDTDQTITGLKAFTQSIHLQGVNENQFIYFEHTGTETGYDWRLGYMGTGSDDKNYFVIQSNKKSTTFNSAIQIGLISLDVGIGKNLYPLTDNENTLGTSNSKWKKLYTNTINDIIDIHNIKSTDRTSAGDIHALCIYGTTYGNKGTNGADSPYTKLQGQLSYGDPGPQIIFGSNNTLTSGQKMALIYSDHNGVALNAGSSLHLVAQNTATETGQPATFVTDQIKLHRLLNLSGHANFQYNSTDKCIDVIFT